MSDRNYLSDDDSFQENSCIGTIEKQKCVSNKGNYKSVVNDDCSKPNVEKETIPVTSAESNFASQCLNEFSFPKNWTYVRKLKEQRQLLHQQLFAKKTDLTEHDGQANENFKKESVIERVKVDNIYNFSDSDGSDSENLVIAESSSSVTNEDSNGNNERTVLANDTKQHQHINKDDNSGCNEGYNDSFRRQDDTIYTYSSDDSDTEDYDCSDLCLLTPSKINDALHVAIASVNDDVCKKKTRIKEVLNKLKMKAECNVTWASPESASYTISKPLNNLPSATSSCTLNLASDKNLLCKDANIGRKRDTNQSPCSDSVKYFGLPYQQCTSKPMTHTDVTENECRKRFILSKDLPQNIDISAEIPTEVGDCCSTKGDACNEDSIDYTNIAFQKLMAERRLKMSSKTDKESQGARNDDCLQDLKMIRTKSKSGTTLVQIEDVTRDINKCDNERDNIIGLFDRMKEVNIARQLMLKAQLGVVEEKKRLMELKRQHLEIGGDDVSISSLSTPSSPILIDVECNNETVANMFAGQEEVKKIKTSDWKSCYVRSKQSIDTSCKKSMLIKSTPQRDNDKNELKSGKSAELPRKSKRIVESKKKFNAKSSMCSILTETARKIPISENATLEKHLVLSNGTIDKRSANCIVSSQSLLKKHLGQKDKDSGFVLLSTDNHHVSATQPLGSAACNTVKTVDKHVLTSKNEILRNVDKSRPPVLNPTAPLDSTKSSTSLQEIPTSVSHKNNPSDPPKTVIMPIGCVKDESTNQVYPTYHYNGFTFALINNKMYHIRMNSPPGIRGTTAGASVPLLTPNTCSATIILPTKSNLVPVFDPNAKRSLVNIKPRLNVKEVTNTSLSSGLRSGSSGHSVSYRLPVNLVTSASTSQAVNLVIVPAKTGGNVGNNVPVQGGQGVVLMSKGNNANLINTTSAQGMVPNLAPQQLQLHPIPGPIATASVVTRVVTSCSNIQPVFRQANQQVYSSNSAVVQSTSADRTSVKVTPSNQLCKSKTGKKQEVALYKHETKHEDNKQKDKISATSKIKSLPSHEVLSSESLPDIDSRHITGADLQKSLSYETISKGDRRSLLSEQISRKRKRKRKTTDSGELVDNVLSSSPVDSINCEVVKQKRKRKGTPAKKVNRREDICDEDSPPTNQGEEPRQLYIEWMAEQEELKKKLRNGDGEIRNKRIETPVPFVNYPARIVSKQSDIDGSKIVSIVGSPKHSKDMHSSTDTSLNEEKMAKMLQFADEFELEQKKKGDNEVRKRGKLKRRKNADSRKRAITDGVKNTSNDRNTCAVLKERIQEKLSPEAQIGRDRSMFAEMEATEVKQCEYSDKDTEVEDQYDSSDLENYENFLLSKTKNSLKRKSQLIESYYTTEGLHERHTPKASEKVQFLPVTEENGVAKKIATDAQVKISCNVIVSAKENFGANPIAGACNSDASADKTSNLLHDVKTVKNDKMVEEQSGTKCDSELMDQSKYALLTNIGTQQDSATANCSSGSNKGCSLNQVTTSGSHYSMHDVFSSANKCPCYIEKKFTKTKMIILKGDMCERWMNIKKQTGFGEMTDPQFVQYLLRLEEERQFRMKQMSPELIIEDSLYYEDTRLSKELCKALTSTPVCTSETAESFTSSPVSSVVDLNNNNCGYSPLHEVDAMLDFSDADDTLVDIVNVSSDSYTHSHYESALDNPSHNEVSHGSAVQRKPSYQTKTVPKKMNVSPIKIDVHKKITVKMTGTEEEINSPPSKKQALSSSPPVTHYR